MMQVSQFFGFSMKVATPGQSNGSVAKPSEEVAPQEKEEDLKEDFVSVLTEKEDQKAKDFMKLPEMIGHMTSGVGKQVVGQPEIGFPVHGMTDLPIGAKAKVNIKVKVKGRPRETTGRPRETTGGDLGRPLETMGRPR